MSDLRQRVFLQSLLFGCLLSALTLSIAHTFFGPRYTGEGEDAEATPCWQSDANSEPTLAVGVPETNLSSLDAEEQLRSLLSLLRCKDMDECIRHARLAGEVRDTYQRHIQVQRRLTLQVAASTGGAQECSGFLGIQDQHPDLVPMAESLRPRPSFQEAFADLNIVGLPKTGTTQLYEILGSHPNVRRLNPNRKENCAVYPRTRRDVVLDGQNDLDKEKRKLQVNLHSFVQSLAAARSGHSSSPGAAPAITLNGCVNFASVAFTWYYLRPTNRKFILMFRDPADWLWSSWNFFDQQKHLDAEGLGRNGWVKKNYPSPELFHELLTSRSQTLGGQWLVNWRCRSLEDPRLLMRMVGRSSILFLRNEDLVPGRINLKGGLLEKVGGFLGINPQKFDPDTYSQIMNCNNKKGFKSKCDNLTTAYKVSGGRSLLPETRVLIYLQFWELCNIWAAEFGIVYPDCLNVINSTAPT